jgi:arsenate reductase
MPAPFRVLFLCTANSARSQMAEALLNAKGGARFVAASAGTHPAPRVNPSAIDALARVGIQWHGHQPRDLAGLEHEPWDFVITVCDSAREACPVFSGQPVLAHWGMEDPAVTDGSDEEKRRAFDLARQLLSRRIDLLIALPAGKLERLALEQRVKAIPGET